MRYKSAVTDNYCIYAVAGTNSVSFGIDFENADTTGLLGFSVKRTYPGDGEHFMPGFKVFQADKDKVTKGKPVSTETEPIQSFVWDDFTLKPGQKYTYSFYPVKGSVSQLVYGNPIIINIQTELAFSNDTHDIFFNRGVASSQAYATEFDNTRPDNLVGKKKQDAFNWLGRDLPEALTRFIGQTKKGETLLGCFYEFNYPLVLDALKAAIDRKVKVKLIIDGKNNTHTVKDKKTGKTRIVPSTPRDNNMKAITTAGIPAKNLIYREANKNVLQHNKFMVYIPGTKPKEVWTGSVNITESGIYGQTNVGHWIRDDKTAAAYKKYWDLLSSDPGAKDGDALAKRKADEKTYIAGIMSISGNVTGAVPIGITPIFSPRDKLEMLEKYFDLVNTAKTSSVITLAFGITADLKTVLQQHTTSSPITFMLLEKEDAANPKSTKTFYKLSAKNNVYESYGSYIADPLYEWVAETNMKKLGVTTFVNYIHSKFLIQDPLGDDPIIVTGSANFSPPSTTDNDENMVLIRGSQRVADIYFTEFNRLFNHYYYRSILDQLHKAGVPDDEKKFYLDDTPGWMDNYKTGKLRRKRVELFISMKNTTTL